MMRPIISLSLSLILTASACAATDRSALDRARAEPEVPSIPVAAASAPQWSEGEARAMLREIDPLGGTWRLIAFDGPPIGRGRRAALQGHEGAFLSTSGDCTSSYSSYVRSGEAIDITRHIPPETRKCDDAAAANLDRALAHAVAATKRWSIDETGRLHLDPAQGRGAVFERTVPRWPALDGRWIVESIGGQTFTATIEFGHDAVSGYAECNSYGAQTKIGAGTLELSNGIQTLAGCGEAREGADGVLFEALGTSTRWQVASDGKLRLSGKSVIVAHRRAPVTYTLAGRYQVCNNSTLPDISHDGEVWLEFAGDTVRDQAGCSARYATSGSSFALTLGQEVACAIPALAQRGAAEIGGARSPLAQFRPTGIAWDRDDRLRLSTARGLLALCRYTP